MLKKIYIRSPHSEKTKQKISKANKGKVAWNKGIPRTEKTKKKLSEAHMGNPGYWEGTHRSEETRKKMSEAHKGKPNGCLGTHRSDKSKKIMKNAGLKKWQNMEFQKMMANARNLKPNKLEQLFDNLTPQCVKYVGDFSLWIKTKKGSRNPDFIIEGQDKVIEIFGNYYHKEEDSKDKIKEYENIGYECKVFWEYEVYNETKRVLNETLKFISKEDKTYEALI